jgi:DNA-binding transcriptional LysR family regulator
MDEHRLPSATQHRSLARPGRRPRVRLELIEQSSVRQVEGLLTGSLDAGFICGPVPGAARRQLVTVPLARESLVEAVPADHPLATEKSLPVTSLESPYPCGDACPGVKMGRGRPLDAGHFLDTKPVPESGAGSRSEGYALLP